MSDVDSNVGLRVRAVTDSLHSSHCIVAFAKHSPAGKVPFLWFPTSTKCDVALEPDASRKVVDKAE